MGQHDADEIELSHTQVEYVIKYLLQNTSKEGKFRRIQKDDIKVYIGEPWRVCVCVCVCVYVCVCVCVLDAHVSK